MLPLLLAASLGVRLPPQPPSLPPASATRQIENRKPRPSGASFDYTYEWVEGFIGAGGDVIPPATATLKEALAKCDVLPRCRGITYEGSNTTTAPQHVYFKNSDGVAKAANWSAWVKRAPVTPPALTLAVGGSSRLSLLLRKDFYTVQNLSRVGELWSFSRPLDSGSTLPMCAHLGDLTLRLRPSPAASRDGGEWQTFSTIELGAKAEPLSLNTSGGGGGGAGGGGDVGAGGGGPILAAQDISRLLASSLPTSSLPLKVVRAYETSEDGAALIIRFNLTSTSSSDIEIGGLGVAMPESPGHPPAGIETVVWNDPHVGGPRGFVEFVRVVDDEATLLVTAQTPLTAGLEAWRPMMEDLGHGDAYEWAVASKAWASEWAANTQYPFLNMSDALKATYPPFGVAPQTPWPSTDGKHSMPALGKSPRPSSGGGAASPWNDPTSIVLKPGQSTSLALRLQLAEAGPRSRNDALEQMGAPVVHGVPGFVLPTDLATAELHVKPPKGATVIGAAADDPTPPSTATLTLKKLERDTGGFEAYRVASSGYGRVRLIVRFSDGSHTSLHYFVLPPLAQQVASLGTHLANDAWLPRDYPDPFGRSASVMPWDRSPCNGRPDGDPCGHVLNDARAYDAGLSDDAGGGNPLCMASKVRAAPTAHEVSRVDDYIRYTLYGVKADTALPPLKSLQIREEEVCAEPDGACTEGIYGGEGAIYGGEGGDAAADFDGAGGGRVGSGGNDVDGVRMTMFYYDDDLNNHTSGHFNWSYTEADKCSKPFGGPTWCMNEAMANATYRGFNYPHQIASYWAMYHVARHTTHATLRPWHWYLYRAAKTCLKLGRAGVGFMDGTVAREVLDALLAEGTAGNATLGALGETLRDNMRARQQGWARTPYPYGSEFGFDTTGQEEVVVWNLYFGNETVARKTVDHILSYMRSSATWAYNGGSRSWGDVGNNGKYLATFGTGSQDRGQMHYRSGLNMIPLIEWYRRHPDEGLFLLEVAMGAITGQMANIDPASGATSMMFHATPHVMDFDPHSGDYGLGFFGNALESGAYYVVDDTLGPLCYLCDVSLHSTTDAPRAPNPHPNSSLADHVTITPRDAYRIAAYIEPLGLYITAQCGTLRSLTLGSAATLAPHEQPPAPAASSGAISISFDADAPCSRLRLKLTKTAKSRPGSGFEVVGGSMVRGAWEVPPASGAEPTVVQVTYAE